MSVKPMKHPVPDEHLTHIGDIVVSFALLEFNVQSLIESLICEHQRIGQIITAELSFKNLRALAISLYHERYGKGDNYLELKELLKEAGNIEDRRNQIIHSIWGTGKDKDHITRIKTTAKEKNGLNFQFQQLSADDFEKFAEKIRECAGNILDFHFALVETGKPIDNPVEKTC